MTSTFCPACTRPRSRTACRAVSAETGKAAACVKVRFAGLGASLPGRALAYSAKETAPLGTMPRVRVAIAANARPTAAGTLMRRSWSRRVVSVPGRV